MYDLIKARLREELKNCPLTTVEISKRVGVSPEMITQYMTTKKLPKLDTFSLFNINGRGLILCRFFARLKAVFLMDFLPRS